MSVSLLGWRLPPGASSRFVFALLLAACVGCKKEPAKAAPSVETPGSVLVAPRGTTPDDEAVREWQTRAQMKDATGDTWVGLADAWLRHARSSGNAADFDAAEAAAVKGEALGARAAIGIRAFALLNRRQFEPARQLAQSALDKDPNELRSLGALADALLELGRLEESAAAVQKMVDLKPNLPSYGRASWLRWLSGDAAAAKKLVRLAIDSGRDPRDVEPRAWMLSQAAGYFWHEGDFEGAEVGYDQALALVPGYPPALVGRARCALSLGEPALAAPLLHKAWEKRPLVETGILRAQALEALKDSGAARAWDEAIAEGRRSGDDFGVGLVFALRNQHLDEAIKLLAKERTARPGPHVLDAYAWALYRGGKLEEAEQASEGATRFGTPDARLWYHLGAIRLARGKRDEGRALIEKALKMNPGWDLVEVSDARALLAAP